MRPDASADLFIFPSITETFGKVTLESMARGLATAAHDDAAARQHLENDVNGYLAPCDDDEAFIEAALTADHALGPEPRKSAGTRASARKVRWTRGSHFDLPPGIRFGSGSARRDGRRSAW